MRFTCLDCKKKIIIRFSDITPSFGYYAKKGIYLCRNCKNQVLLDDLKKRYKKLKNDK